MSSTTLTQQHAQNSEKTLFGFWVYIMTDCILFASLFVTYIVLAGNTMGGPTAGELFSLPFVLTETMLLLTSSFTAGLAVLAAKLGHPQRVVMWLSATFVLGATFLGMELYEFAHLVREGHSWQENGFLSGFFALVGTHGIHITAGLIWILVLVRHIAKKGITAVTGQRLLMWGLFWHFLDIVWIFIFTFVYLMGAA